MPHATFVQRYKHATRRIDMKALLRQATSEYQQYRAEEQANSSNSNSNKQSKTAKGQGANQRNNSAASTEVAEGVWIQERVDAAYATQLLAQLLEILQATPALMARKLQLEKAAAGAAGTKY